MTVSSEKKIVGKVTNEERDEIRALFERKNGLTELFQTISVNNEEGNMLYERIVADMGKVTTKFKAWWSDMSQKYDWEGLPGHNWEIDFNTCDIFIIIKKDA
jgi:CXXX repeat modification system protein